MTPSLQAPPPPLPPQQPALLQYGPPPQASLPQVQQEQQQDLGDMIERLMLQGESRSIRVHVGIDEDLKMILDMDPSIVDMVPPLAASPGHLHGPQATPGAPGPEPAPVPVQHTSPRLSRLPPRG